MDKTTVCRKALQLFCDSEYKEGTNAARACDLWYADAVGQACARYGWSFTRREVVLEALANSSRRVAEFQLPDDCIKVVRVCSEGALDDLEVEMMVGRRMLLRATDLRRVRVFYQSDLSVFEGAIPGEQRMFCKGVVHLLAGYVCGAVGPEFAGLREGFLAQAERAFMDAVTADAQQLRRIRSVKQNRGRGLM